MSYKEFEFNQMIDLTGMFDTLDASNLLASTGKEIDQKKALRDLAAWMPKFTDPMITSSCVIMISDCVERSQFDELLLVNMSPAKEEHIFRALLNVGSFLERCLTSNTLYMSEQRGQVFVCVQIERGNIYALPMKEILAGRWFKFNIDMQ